MLFIRRVNVQDDGDVVAVEKRCLEKKYTTNGMKIDVIDAGTR